MNNIITKTPQRYTPKMTKIILKSFADRTTCSQRETAQKILTDFKQLWPTNSFVKKLTPAGICSKYQALKTMNGTLSLQREPHISSTIREIPPIVAADRAVVESSRSGGRTYTEPAPKKTDAIVNKSLKSFAIKMLMDSDDITISTIQGKLVITL